MGPSSLKVVIVLCLSLVVSGFSACTSPNSQSSRSQVSQSSMRSPQAMNGEALDQPALCPSGEFSKRTGYSICFNSAKKQAIWVSYELTRERLMNPVTDRSDDFTTDTEFNSASPTDFYGTIYERGHLVPSADMKWSQKAQAESFSMANMTPQTHMMNHGRWKDLEEQVRNWAKKFGRISIVMGPMPTAAGTQKNVPGTDIPVPKEHFKCVLFSGAEAKTICFVIPQEPSETLPAYIHTVDDVEAATGLDFFSSLDDSVEDKIEAKAVLEDWMRGLSMKPFLNSSRPQRSNSNSNSKSKSRLQDRIDSKTGVFRQGLPAQESAHAFDCKPKTCKQIRSCAEAKFLLETCGLKRLDSDGNGVPCEALCK